MSPEIRHISKFIETRRRRGREEKRKVIPTNPREILCDLRVPAFRFIHRCKPASALPAQSKKRILPGTGGSPAAIAACCSSVQAESIGASGAASLASR